MWLRSMPGMQQSSDGYGEAQTQDLVVCYCSIGGMRRSADGYEEAQTQGLAACYCSIDWAQVELRFPAIGDREKKSDSTIFEKRTRAGSRMSSPQIEWGAERELVLCVRLHGIVGRDSKDTLRQSQWICWQLQSEAPISLQMSRTALADHSPQPSWFWRTSSECGGAPLTWFSGAAIKARRADARVGMHDYKIAGAASDAVSPSHSAAARSTSMVIWMSACCSAPAAVSLL
ncbi:hypothetical protein DFH09DRAFT_1089164 [Mycena vulgaris]|nr:hypothetical protein DFH09DRAFT_1089164 [Mycena vulgaris]